MCNRSSFLLIVFVQVGILSAASLQEQFQNPPDSARPGVYWYFMDGNLTKDGMTADLEAMRDAGLGNLIFLEVNVGVPRGPVEFMSHQWQALFAHAVSEAKRLGIEITLNAGPGWTGSGGPWIKPSQSMQHLLASQTQVTGPAAFNDVLPVPPPRAPYFGERNLSEEMLRQRQEYFNDVAVLAIPVMEAAGVTADIDEKALYKRDPYTSVPNVKAFLPEPPAQTAETGKNAIELKKIIDLTNKLHPDGRLKWQVPAGKWTIMRFVSRDTGANTRPAPVPGLGFECDKFDKSALDYHFNEFIGRLLKAIDQPPANETGGWTMLHIDSWEMGAQNWTGEFRQEFKKRRGYDPLMFLPAWTGCIIDNQAVTERFLWDLRLTAQELVLENHAEHLKKLGQRHGFGLSIEPYDMNPTSDLVLGSVADVPMCEFWSMGYGFDSAFSCVEAASIARTLGRPIVAAEAFTAHQDAWKLYPQALKNQSDWALAMGVNKFVFHTFAHKPSLTDKPGMTMGPYGVHWDRTQTWWPMVGAYHRYLTRCQNMLRQGKPVADICYLIPEGAPHVFKPPLSALDGQSPIADRKGYNFDGCTPQILSRAEVQNDKLVLPGGGEYSLFVLPDCQTMRPELLCLVEELVKKGITVVGNPPLRSPSLVDYPACDRQVQKLAKKIWGDRDLSKTLASRRYGKGTVISGKNLYPISETANAPKELYPHYRITRALLAAKDCPQDFDADKPIRYTHRVTDSEHIYFVANKLDERIDAVCRFRVTGHTPRLWDPLTGQTRSLQQFKEIKKKTEITLRFEPHQSFFIVFTKEPAIEQPKLRDFPEIQSLAVVNGPWQVEFDTQYGGPGQVAFDSLSDWSTHSNPAIRYYSGRAVYRTNFEKGQWLNSETQRLSLNLGEVYNLAQVKLNGQDIGVIWCAPWRIDITDFIKEGSNALEITIANLWPNRLIGDKISQQPQITQTNYNPYKPDDPLLKSGLLGPVTIECLDFNP